MINRRDFLGGVVKHSAAAYMVARAKGLIPADANYASDRQPNGARLVETLPPISLASFAQRSFHKPLDLWQLDLCERLQGIMQSRGRRVLIHCMPQIGKTILVSQRFPVYAIGCNPLLRVRVLMYNISHARNKSGRVAKELMHSPVFRETFGNTIDLAVPNNARNEEWATRARVRIGDGQSSFKCFGLETGATGEGGDLWIFDDPYPSAAQAFSDNYNAAVWQAWEDTVKPRLGPNDNVVIMFHRYHVNDLAGQLLEKEPDDWELWRYAAVADGDYVVESSGRTFPCFPLNRPLGEVLSRRYPDSWYASKQKNGVSWRGQFQGRPTEQDGDTFNMTVMQQPGMRVRWQDVPPNLPTVRAYDFAGTEGGGARTAGIQMKGPDKNGIIYITDSLTAQKGTRNRTEMIKAQAALDGYGCEVGLPQDPGSAGKDTVYFTAKELIGFRWWSYPARQDKAIRAQPYADAWNAGLIKVVIAPWNAQFFEVHRQFPNGAFKDEVDAASDGFKRLSRKKGKKKPKTTTQDPFA